MKGMTRLLVGILLLAHCAQAQVQQAWVARHSSPGSYDDIPVNVSLDNAANVYVAGHGFYTNSGVGSYDYAVVKYDFSGNQQWVARYNSPNHGQDFVIASAADENGNVFVTGFSSTGENATVKFDSAGTRIWVVQFDNRATAIKVDGSGNVYVTGFSSSPYEIVTIKYNSSGTQMWVARYDDTEDDPSPSIIVMDIDSAGNVYVSGRSIVPALAYVYTTIKYDNNGNQLWVAYYNSPDVYRSETPRAIAVDSMANVLVTGPAGTVKYDSAGNQLWVDSDWYGIAATVDNGGNAYVTGLYPSYAAQFATVKYDEAGNRLWWSRYLVSDRTIRYDFPSAIALDNSGNIYVTGYTGGTNEAGMLAGDDFSTIKYNPNGNLSWSVLYHHTNSPPFAGDRAKALAVDASGNVYVTGSSVGYHAGVSDAWTDDYATVKYTQTSVPGIPTIITPPQHQSAPENTDVTFTVQATGNLPLRYQWRFNGRSLPNETNSTLVLTLVQLHQAGDYSVVVSNSLGRTISPEAQLTVLARARIDYISAGGTVLGGQLFAFYSGASGTPPLHYQWRHNGVDIAGANNTSLQLTDIHPSQAGDYSVVVTNNYGAATSSVSRLEVEIFRINSQPAPYASVVAGNTWSLFVGVSGKAPFQFQWRRNGEPIGGQTAASIYFLSIHPTNAGTYSVEVTNEYGSMVSSNAVIEVVPLRITRQPQSQSAQVDECVSLIVEAQSFSQPQYQWQLNGANIPTGTNAILTFTAIQSVDAGDYRVVVSNTYGAVTSAVARLSVGPAVLGDWTWRNPQPQGNGLRGVAYGNGRFVAVGGYGAIVTSTDGLNWRARNVRSGNFNAVTFGNGQFVAVGEQQTVFASSNGLDWVCRQAPQGPPSTNLTTIIFGNGVFVAAGNAGVYSSSNALVWTRNSFSPGAYSLAFGDGRFIAAASGGVYDLSNNGLGWTHTSTLALGTLLFANGEFLGWTPSAYNQYRLYASPNGDTWTARRTINVWQVSAFAYGAGNYVILNSQNILRSPDTLAWSTDVPNTTNSFWNVGFGGGRFVAVGENGSIITSSDGINWQRASWATDDNIRGVTWSGDQYVAVGNRGRIWRSRDGRQWTTNAIATSQNLRGVAYGRNRFVAVGQSGIVFSSTDGVNWVQQPSASESLYGITFADGLFVSVGEDGLIRRSLDGLSWVQTTASFDRLQGIGWGNGLFVATGRQGVILTSPNGVVWSRRPAATIAYLEAVTYGNGLYIASGEDGTVAISSNGVDWTSRRIPSAADINVYPSWEGVAAGAGYFILGGDTGEILVSTNGVDWIRSFHGSDNGLRGAMFARGAFLVIGNNETILQSSPLLPILEVRGLTENGFELWIDAPPHGNYLLQGSSDFINWSDLFNFSNSSRRTFYLDDEAADFSRRFYRVVAE